jgi:heme/copper-type cytochrome/quinol oxidase subunit 1
MNRREIAFLLIGLSTGTVLATAAAIVGFVIWSHHMFIVGIAWPRTAIALTVLLLPVLIALSLLYRSRSKEA